MIKTETAYLAAGCFWGIEHAFRETHGVVDAVSGYMGGHVPTPDYQQVCRGNTGHAETVKVIFDPARIDYRQIIQRFLSIHDPTQVNRQGPDIGTQYRSAIFATSDEQQQTAQKVFGESASSFHQPIATQVIRDSHIFYPAEEYHQRYIEKNRSLR